MAFAVLGFWLCSRYVTSNPSPSDSLSSSFTLSVIAFVIPFVVAIFIVVAVPFIF